MFKKIFAMIIFVFLGFVVSYGQPVPGIPEIVNPATMSVQPSGSDSLHWSSGRYNTIGRNGTTRTARGIEVLSSSTGGVIKIHLKNDFDAAGRPVWLLYSIPASGGSTQRIGLIFDMVDSAGTTIAKTDIIVWY